MKGKRSIGIFLGILLAASVAACAGAQTPPPVTPIPGPTALAPSADRKAAEAGWEETVSKASKEGVVNVGSSMAPGVKQSLSEGLKNKYGITIEVLSARPAEFLAKLEAERRAGIYNTDVLVAGLGTILSAMGPTGDLDSLDAVLALPEVTNKDLWYGGRLPFVDKTHYYFAMCAFPKAPVAINTTLVKPDEIKSYRDLLAPRFKGKILFGDPTIGGAANSLFAALAESLMDLDYLKQLAGQDLSIQRDERLMVEWLARGKYAVLLGPKEDAVQEFVAAGAPISLMSPKEGTYLLTSGFGIYLLKKPPHPNAVKVFINWFLSKEGQTILSRSARVQSARLDVPADHLPPEAVRQPGQSYFWMDSEEMVAKREEYKIVAKEIWKNVMK